MKTLEALLSVSKNMGVSLESTRAFCREHSNRQTKAFRQGKVDGEKYKAEGKVLAEIEIPVKSFYDRKKQIPSYVQGLLEAGLV